MAIIAKTGDRGARVRIIQRLLKIYPDGIYGPMTREAVTEFQQANGITADGIVGPKTWSLLLGYVLLPSKRTITEIIVHCTATPEGKPFTVEDIRRWHKAQGWSNIGYHYVVYLDGTIHKGRDVNIAGAHCVGHNTHSIGVVYVGGVDLNGKAKDTRTQQQKDGLLGLLMELKRIYPAARIYGHRDFSTKACPSFDAKKEYSVI